MRAFTTVLLALAAVGTAATAQADTYFCTSPGSSVVITLSVGEALHYAVTADGETVVAPSPIALHLRDHGVLGDQPVVVGVNSTEIDEVLRPVLKVKNAEVPNHCSELRVRFEGGYAIRLRAYEDGAAYRFETELGGTVDVLNEHFTARFEEDFATIYPDENSLLTHQERQYLETPLSEVGADRYIYMPALVRAGRHTVAITESDLYDYPGMSLRGDGSPAYLGVLPGVAVKENQQNDRTVEVTARADYIARTEGTRSFPWRVFAVAREDADLVRNELVLKLARPCEIEDTSWVRPGKVAWDWYNANNIFGVPFRAGINTETYKYYIDFASEHGIEYIILDEGWYVLPDLLKIAPNMDIEEIFAYAKSKDVAVIPWVTWKSLEDQLEPAMDQFARWGAAGIKVDFMQRDDQWMVNYYWRIAKEAAKRKMLVDFHGSYKPAGLRRTYPNVITREGVQGAEHNKWSQDITPGHNVTIPFTRMLAGPMDYTPGSMVNVTREEHADIFNRPMTQGTRCHQLAMYVIYESPLQMLCENPSIYREEPECMEFLGPVPSVWDETVVLQGELGEYIAIARRNGGTWYVGAMTNWTPRTLELPLAFLGRGRWSARIWKDGVNADRYAEDFAQESRRVTAEDTLSAAMGPGGGWVAVIED